MDYSISSEIVDDVIEFTAEAVCNNAEELNLMADQYITEISDNGLKKALIDERGVAHLAGIMEQVRAAKHIMNNHPAEVRRWKIAVVIDPEYSTVTDFFETYVANRGYSIRVFYTMQEAKAFLGGF